MGTYLHGLFAADGFRRAFLAALGAPVRRSRSYEAGIETTLDALAAHLEAHLDLDALLALAREPHGLTMQAFLAPLALLLERSSAIRAALCRASAIR